MSYPTTGVFITGPLAVGSSLDSYPTHIAELGKGGYVSAETITIRDAITTDRKTTGMACYVWNDGTSSNNGLYIWNGTSWTAYSSLFTPTISDATTGAKGIVKIGNNINVSSGTISVANATTSVFGVVKVGNGLQINGSTGALDVTTTDPLEVFDNNGNSVGISGELQFKGLGFSTSNTGTRNVITFTPTNIYVGSTSYPDITSLKFLAGSNVTITPNNTTSNILELTIAYSSGLGVIVQALNDLTDVTLTTPTDGQFLKYESSSGQWKNATFTGITLTSLTASAPLSYNNSTGAFSIATASTSTDGYLTATDWNTFNGKQPAGSYATTTTSINTTAPLTGGGDLSTNRTISIPAATGSVNGYLTSTDWTTFNGKQNAIGYTTANDSLVVHLSGTETITGNKTLSGFTAMGSASVDTNYILNLVTNGGTAVGFRLTDNTNTSSWSYGIQCIGTTLDLRSGNNFTLRYGNNGLQILSGKSDAHSSLFSTFGGLTINQKGGSYYGAALSVVKALASKTGPSTTANNSTTITIASGGSVSVPGSQYSLGVGDRVTINSVTATVTSISSTNTFFTTSTALGNGTTQTITYLNAIGSFYDSSGALKFIINDEGRVGINAVILDRSARLQIDSTTEGVLLPRMTTTQRTSISNPAESLLVYDTTENSFYYYKAGGPWAKILT